MLKPDKDGDPDLKPERLWDAARANALRDKCLGKPGVVTEESKPSTQLSPLLYDLTSLQREANGRFGFSASGTLKLAQTLYERHKVLTYPRTDSRALPEDYLATVKSTLEHARRTPVTASSPTPFSRMTGSAPTNAFSTMPRYPITSPSFPTTEPPRNLSEAEQKLYDMVTRRFLAVFYPAAEFLETTRITRVEGEPFKTIGKVLVSPGWLAVYGKEAQTEDTATLPPVTQNETVQTTEVEVKQSQTKPPPRFTEATLAQRYGRRGQTRRRRRAARGDERKGSGHTRDPGRDHRRAHFANNTSCGRGENCKPPPKLFL